VVDGPAVNPNAPLHGGSSIALTYHVAQLLFGQWPIGDGAEPEPEVIVEPEPQPEVEVTPLPPVQEPDEVTPPVQVEVQTRQLTECEELRIAIHEARRYGSDIKGQNRRLAYEAMRAGDTDSCYLGLGTTCTAERIAVLSERLARIEDWVSCLEGLDAYRGTGCCDLEGKVLRFGQWIREGHHGRMRMHRMKHHHVPGGEVGIHHGMHEGPMHGDTGMHGEGAMIREGDVYHNAPATMNGNLEIHGNVYFNSTATANGNMNYYGETYYNADVTVNGAVNDYDEDEDHGDEDDD
ncbi:MAG TPA: hypothetical protein VEI97_09070, partial [bacterium]|nr:hypothetical protein [bacterium]